MQALVTFGCAIGPIIYGGHTAVEARQLRISTSSGRDGDSVSILSIHHIPRISANSQNDFPELPALLHQVERRARFFKREHTTDHRPETVLGYKSVQCGPVLRA